MIFATNMKHEKVISAVPYKGYDIDFLPSREEWRVVLGQDNVVQDKSLKVIQKAIREHEEKNKKELKPFWAIVKEYGGKTRRIYIVNINGRNHRIYYKTSENSKKIDEMNTRWGTDVYPDTETARVTLALVDTYKMKQEEAERLTNSAEAKLEKLELGHWDIAQKLGKEE